MHIYIYIYIYIYCVLYQFRIRKLHYKVKRINFTDMWKSKPFTNFRKCEWTARLEIWRCIVGRVLPDLWNHPLCPSSSAITHACIIQHTLSFHTAILLGSLDREDEGTTIIRNVGKYSPNDTSSHPRSLESSARHGLPCILCKYRLVLPSI
jgi:hypothetical protein